jgi:hypothetical protein
MPKKICSAKKSGKVRFTNAPKDRLTLLLRELGLTKNDFKWNVACRMATRMINN